MSDTDLSLIVPVYNEQECIEGTLDEAHGVMRKLGRPFEILAINDGSNDATLDILLAIAGRMTELVVLSLDPNSGQSVAMGAGIRHSRGKIIVFMDADGQNDPAGIPRLLDGLKDADMCCGYRANRKDSFSKVLGSRVANAVRNRVLGETIIDTGCTLKAVRADIARQFVMLKGMHRFLPTMAAMAGARITQIPVQHRARRLGTSKYTNARRLKETIGDLWAVRWMQTRNRRPTVKQETR
jgi:glycosyltransferase involved in cell wall biosynthesis